MFDYPSYLPNIVLCGLLPEVRGKASALSNVVHFSGTDCFLLFSSTKRCFLQLLYYGQIHCLAGSFMPERYEKSILLRRKTQLIHQSLINPLDSFSRFSLPSYPVVTRGCLSVHKAICKFFLIPVTLGTAAFLAFFTVRNCNAAPHKRNKTELSALRTPKKINSRPDGRNKKNQF